MKEDVNIEELFKQKFENFEADVDPSVWANVQQGVHAAGSGASGAAGGISTIAKVAIIASTITVTTLGVIYFSDKGNQNPEEKNNPIVQTTKEDEESKTEDQRTNLDVKKMGKSIQVTDTSDPEIQKNIDEIDHNLSEQHISDEDIDDELVESIVPDRKIEDITVDLDDDEMISPNLTDDEEIYKESINEEQQSSENSNQEETEEVYPSGMIEYEMEDQYAPSKVSFYSNAANYKRIEWIFSNGTVLEGEQVKLTFNKSGTYKVILKVYGEDDVYEEEQNIEIKTKSSIDNIPNVITPNGDRKNDEFSINTTDIETFYISIRNKKGEEVFSSRDKNFRWDANDLKGNKVEKGIYTYVIVAEGLDGSVFKIPGQLYVQ